MPTFADWCAVDLVDGGELERVALAHADPEKLGLGRQLGEPTRPTWTPPPASPP